jgi:hypothetical protein
MREIILSDEEQILFQTRFSLLKFLRLWVGSMAICGGGIFLAEKFGQQNHAWSLRGDLHHTIALAFSGVAIAAFLVFLMGWLLYRHQRIVLTTHRLVQTSLWNLRSDSIVLRNINNIEKRRTLLGLIFGYGTLKLQDTDGSWINLPFIPRVDILESKLATASMRQGPLGGAK